MKEVSILDVGGKPQRSIQGKNPRDRVGTENPIHLVPPAGIRTRVLEVEGEERTSAPTRPPIMLCFIASVCRAVELCKRYKISVQSNLLHFKMDVSSSTAHGPLYVRHKMAGENWCRVRWLEIVWYTELNWLKRNTAVGILQTKNCCYTSWFGASFCIVTSIFGIDRFLCALCIHY